MIRQAHLWVGIIGMVLFVLSGQYFYFALDGLAGFENTPRLLLRTSHIYLFFAAFINLVFGLYYLQPPQVRWYTVANQSLLMLSPVLIGYGFVFEAFDNPGIERPVSTIGIYLPLAWLIHSAIGYCYRRITQAKPDRKP